MKRWLVTSLAAISVLLSAVTMVLWLRCYLYLPQYRYEALAWEKCENTKPLPLRRWIGAASYHGRLSLFSNRSALETPVFGDPDYPPHPWRFVSGTTNNILASSKIGLLSVKSYAANDTNCVALWSSE